MITSFRGEYRFLSNFYPCEIFHEGICYPSAENAYQASKTSDLKKRAEISKMTAAEAKKAGYEVQLDPEFEINKVAIMEKILRLKFKDPILWKKLWATEGGLIEGNTWHDNTWGVCVCEKCADKDKHNFLGRLLTKIRDEQ